MNTEKNYELLKNYLTFNDIHVVGVADMANYSKGFEGDQLHPILQKMIDKLPFAVSFGFKLSGMVLETVEEAPNPFYAFHYRRINQHIDGMEVRLSSMIEEKGHNAMPVPASQVVDFKKMTAHLSHRHIAYLAGLGWYGRNNLLVHPRYGSRLRFGTVLTDMPLPAALPLSRDCASCRACITSCPAGAIRNDYREFDRQKCMDKLKEFSKMPGIADHICGVCVKMCRGDRTYGNN